MNSWKNTKGNINKSKAEIESNNYKGIYFNREVKNNLFSQKDIYGTKAGDFIPLTEITEAYNAKNLSKDIKDNITDRVFMLESYRGCPFSCSYCLWGVASKKIDFIPIINNSNMPD